MNRKPSQIGTLKYLRDHAKITSQPPTWRRLSVCRVPTLRDALWSTPGRRPDESGRGRHECRRHIARACYLSAIGPTCSVAPPGGPAFVVEVTSLRARAKSSL